jgi:hypothetical protein
MSISRIVLIRQPVDLVWRAMQDELGKIATFMPAVAAIRCVQKTKDADGRVHTIHEWHAAAGLPAAIESRTNGEALKWMERAEWDASASETKWQVESQLLGPSLTGSGVTRFERAMGGQGTRVSFTVDAQLKGDALGPLGELKWTGGLATAATAVLAKTLQDLCVATESYLKNGNGLASTNAAKQRNGRSK